MNIILITGDDFTDETHATLRDRRFTHIRDVHRATVGDELRVGMLNGRIGRGAVSAMNADSVSLEVTLDEDPPAKLPLTLVVALPRPKVFNRVVAGAVSMGVKEIYFINAWRVEKSYWKSPRLSDANVQLQSLLGLEQARDTVPPKVTFARFFRKFVEEELADISYGSRRLIAHPVDAVDAPRQLTEPVALVIGPEGGFIPDEIALLESVGFQSVSFGPRILRVETVIPYLIGRLY
jgi:16S rRNA (uracil1498-N3)-methyltransferase